MKTSSFFEFYGTILEIAWKDPRHAEMAQWIEEDFSYFLINESKTPNIKITISADLKEKPLFPFLKTKMCLSYGWFWQRVCFYDSSTMLFQSFKKQLREAVIKGTDTDLVYEILYTYVLSSVGEALEKKGFMRFHALGIEKGGKAKVYMLPSQGGKSSLAYQLLTETDAKIFSDEMILTDGEKVYPFPLRIALNEETFEELVGNEKDGRRLFKRRKFENKFLIPIEPDRVAQPAPIGTFYAPHIFYFFWSGFWGLGLCQMAEFMLSLPNAWFLLKASVRRKLILFKILFRKQFKRLKKRKPVLKDIF